MIIYKLNQRLRPSDIVALQENIKQQIADNGFVVVDGIVDEVYITQESAEKGCTIINGTV